ncbi:MAG: hypothetical protein WCQ20_13935 [Synechococcaceae cyanobacterium ELA739]|jgi:hypothetical protein
MGSEYLLTALQQSGSGGNGRWAIPWLDAKISYGSGQQQPRISRRF